MAWMSRSASVKATLSAALNHLHQRVRSECHTHQWRGSSARSNLALSVRRAGFQNADARQLWLEPSLPPILESMTCHEL
jgi:hypothetical protein